MIALLSNYQQAGLLFGPPLCTIRFSADLSRIQATYPMASKVTTYRILVNNEAGDHRILISWASPDHPLPIVMNEYGTIIRTEGEAGHYLMDGIRYTEVERTLDSQLYVGR
jgi:hypothetical protein